MAPSLSRKSDAASSSSPAWHPNLRIAEQLPDTKVVRTAFFINGFAALIVIVLALMLGHEEWTLHGVRKEISEWQHTIDQDKKQSREFVALYGDFKAEEAKSNEVTEFVASKPVVSEIILRLGAITPKKIAFDSLDFKDTGVTIKATIKGAPDRASGDASAYEKQLRTDKVLGPMFMDVNLLGMRKNPTTNRLVIEIFCAYKKGPKKDAMTNQELLAFVRKNAISVACVAMSIGIGATLYLRSGLLPDEERVLADKSKQGELIAANIEDSHQLKDQYTAIVAANQAIANRMIHVGQIAENYQYFYRLESATGTKLSGDPHQIPWTPPPKTAAKTTYTPVGFTVAAQGTYVQLLDFLRRLENGEHYCRIITCNIRPLTEQRSTQLTLSLSIELMGIQ